MKVSYNWLKEYVVTDTPADELAEALTMGGLEVEGVEHIGSDLEGVVVGRVLGVRPHPNAHRLTLCDVDLGRGAPVQIVCGAPNVAADQRVPVATVGSTLRVADRENPQKRVALEIRNTKLRGEISEGMICAEDELGLSDDHTGIMVLEDGAEIGISLEEHFRRTGRAVADTILDVSITPNRPDAASHFGVARDAAALTASELKRPEVALPSAPGGVSDEVSVDIVSGETCPRYVAMVVRGVTVGESPAWLKARLSAIGLRPRNNIVDATNFVLHEIGQPLHAFDLDEIAGRTIRIHVTENESTFRTLDGKERRLPAGTMMIADAERDVAIAGVMGGENSEVTNRTANILIESAYFDPRSIRKTARVLGLQTDASYRFERGVDRDGQVWAAARAAELIAELAGGQVVDGVIDAKIGDVEDRIVRVRSSRIDSLLGSHVPAVRAKQLLEAIGFRVDIRTNGSAGSVLDCRVPTYRPDVYREVDVIEEIVRLHGYDRIPEPDRTIVPTGTLQMLPEDRLRRAARGFLSSVGYREIYTNSMLSRDLADRFGAISSNEESAWDPIVEALNPISQDMSALRPNLATGALQVMSYNRKHGRRMLRFFELGHVFRKNDRSNGLIPGYDEREALLVVASGPAAPVGWDVEERSLDLFDVKGTLDTLLESIGVPEIRYEPRPAQTGVVRDLLRISSGENQIGLLAHMAESVAEDLDFDESVYVAELDWAALVDCAAPQLEHRYRTISRYPVVDRDLAVIVEQEQPTGPLIDTIRGAGGSLLASVDVFDLYSGEAIGAGKKSIAFALRFGADRTLLDEDVDERIAAIVKELSTRHGAVLRG